MKPIPAQTAIRGAGLIARLARLLRREDGSVTPIMVFSLIPLIGAMALGGEVAGWYLTQRNMQNAADSAAVAAATNNDYFTGGVTYASEAKSVASKYGFTDGSNNITVTPLAPVACTTYVTSPVLPATLQCYKVTIAKQVPLYLVPVLGYRGSPGSNGAQMIRASAIASGPGAEVGYCMEALGYGKKDGITINGGPTTDLTGCSLGSNSGLTCNGANSDNGVPFGNAVGTSTCGDVQNSNQPAPVVDLTGYNYTDNAALLNPSPSAPYANTCGATNYHYLTDTGAKAFTNLPVNPPLNGQIAGNRISGNVDWSGQSVVQVCGDLTLTATANITTASPGTVLIIENGQLNVPAGVTLNATGLTVVFSQTSSTDAIGDTKHYHFPTGGGKLAYSAPSTGTWKGIALYQDPYVQNNNYTVCSPANRESNLDICLGGQAPTWYITGLIYAPNAMVTISGAINHAPGGYACFSIIAKSILLNGTNSVFSAPTSQCDRAGLELPGVPGTAARQALLQ